MSNNMKNVGPILINDGLKKYMMAIFNKMFFALGLSGVTAFLLSAPRIAEKMAGLSMILFLATLGISFYLSSRINKISASKAENLFWAYAILLGAALSPIFALYTKASIVNAFFTAALFFAGMSIYGHTTKRDLTNVGSFAIVGLITMIVTSFINALFLHSSLLELGLSAIFVVIFSALTAYDIQKIRNLYSESHDKETLSKQTTMGAFVLFLDFINLFLQLLRFLGNRSK